MRLDTIYGGRGQVVPSGRGILYAVPHLRLDCQRLVILYICHFWGERKNIICDLLPQNERKFTKRNLPIKLL